MLTPAFELSQDPAFLILTIRVPYTRTSEFDLYIDGDDFKFYAKPYFLRLTLPGKIVEDGREKATFDIDKGLFTLRVPKETAGEHFEGLQMLTSLLAPKGSRSAKPLVEDMEACSGIMDGEEEDDEDEFDWQVEQEVYMDTSEEQLKELQKYGFGSQRSGVFTRLQEELSDVIDIRNPDGTTASERRRKRLDAETSIFCPDHYLADLFEDEEIQGLLKFRPWWSDLCPDSIRQGEAAVSFTDDEKEQLRKFTNHSYILDKKSRFQVWLSLVDIILAYCYELRTTEGEHNVESPWTIRKLSGTLCWLETYSSLQEVLVSFGRRVLCYPLYRHFSLVSAAVQDAAQIFQSGKACVLKFHYPPPSRPPVLFLPLFSLWKRKRLDGQLIIDQTKRTESPGLECSLSSAYALSRSSSTVKPLENSISLISVSQGDETAEGHLWLSAFQSASLFPSTAVHWSQMSA
uniref:Protein SHQ1 homolog n=1 Tax=Salmo trutta TaxID=8032 RepID=A0A674C849_SALTR